MIADIKINFDKDGKIKDDFKINGFLKDAKLDLLKKLNVEKLNFNFEVDKKSLSAKNLVLNVNNLNFISEKIILRKKNNDFFIEGQFNNEKFQLDEDKIKIFIRDNFLNFDVNKIIFSSSNSFSFKVDKNYKFKDFTIVSDLKIDQLVISDDFELKNIFPKINKELDLTNHNLRINYENKRLSIEGKGNILFQNKRDLIDYSIKAKNKIYKFNSSLTVKNNPIYIEYINFKSNEDIETKINLKGTYDEKNKIQFKLISIKR